MKLSELKKLVDKNIKDCRDIEVYIYDENGMRINPLSMEVDTVASCEEDEHDIIYFS